MSHSHLPQRAEMLRDVLAGLARPEKALPCKYFYDEAGSRLFEQICQLDEYYPTRCELAILRRHAAEMAAAFGPSPVLIEYGSGASLKTRLLLDRLASGVYVPVDISREHLHQTAGQLARDHPGLHIVPVCADFTQPFRLPALPQQQQQQQKSRGGKRIVYFSGSTIGNFGPAEAVSLLEQIAEQIGPDGGLLIGVDLKKDRRILEPAYDDARGVTAAFNRNLLARINRELGADFDLEQFSHRAFYNEGHGRVEMHLVSRREQAVSVAGRRFAFAAGEGIRTEYSYKFSLDDFARLAGLARLTVSRVWLDDRGLFSVQYAHRTRRGGS